MEDVYVLLETSYEDDYKHRYDSGVSVNIIGVYSSLEKAENKKLNEVLKALCEHLDYLEECDKTTFNKFKKYFTTGNNIKTHLRPIYPKDFILKLSREMLIGNYVDYLVGWEIKKMEFDK